MLRTLEKNKVLYIWTLIFFAILYTSLANYEPDPKSVTISANQPYTLETGDIFIGNGETEVFMVSTNKNFTLTKRSDDTPVATGIMETPDQFESETRFSAPFLGQSGQEYTSDQTLQVYSKTQATIQVKEYSLVLGIIIFVSLILFAALAIFSLVTIIDALTS